MPASGIVALVHDVTMANDDQPARNIPNFLTVEEAARILRIGRTYEQTRRYEETDGREGIPVIRVGRLMRVPRAALERWNGGPLTGPEPDTKPEAAERPRPSRRKPRYPQQGLPLEG